MRRTFLDLMGHVFELRREGRRLSRPCERRNEIAEQVRRLMGEAREEMARIMAEARATDYGRVGASR